MTAQLPGSVDDDPAGRVQPRLRRRLPAAGDRPGRPRHAHRRQSRRRCVPQGLRARLSGVAAAAGARAPDDAARAHGAARLGAVPRGDLAGGHRSGRRRPRGRAREARRRRHPRPGRLRLVPRRPAPHRHPHRPLPEPHRRARRADRHVQRRRRRAHAAGRAGHPAAPASTRRRCSTRGWSSSGAPTSPTASWAASGGRACARRSGAACRSSSSTRGAPRRPGSSAPSGCRCSRAATAPSCSRCCTCSSPKESSTRRSSPRTRRGTRR